jgi:hypothetical protein
MVGLDPWTSVHHAAACPAARSLRLERDFTDFVVDIVQRNGQGFRILGKHNNLTETYKLIHIDLDRDRLHCLNHRCLIR